MTPSNRVGRRKCICTALLVTTFAMLPMAALPDDHAEVVDAVMQRVLAGDLPAARLAADALRQHHRDELFANLATELRDLERGGYATTNNRSFPDLAPFWSAARSRWLAGQPQPHDRLPSDIIALPDAVERVLLVDAGHSSAWLMRRRADAGWMLETGFYVSIGASGLDKHRRGDRRTPLGVYYATEQLDTRRLPARYGSSVLTLDYPNALDVAQGRTGDGIWLHGIDPDNNIRPPRDTDGCIAFDNARIDALTAALDLHHTPVVVAPSFDWQPGETFAATADELRRALERWRASQLSGNSASLIGMYVGNYSRHGLSPELWRAGVRARLSAGLLDDLQLDALEILRADRDEGIFLTRFRQVLHRAGRTPVTTMRRLYWQRIDGEWHIVAEQNG